MTAHDAAEALRWWSEAGVDLALDETPHDRFTESAAPAARRAPTPAAASAPRAAESARQAPALTAPPDEAQRSAREAAAAARSLEELRAALERFQGCGLKATATQLVFADGAPGGADHAGGRGAGRRRRPDRTPVRRPRRAIARPHARRHRTRPHQGLHRQRRALAPAGQPHADSPGDRGLPAFVRRQIALVAPRILVCLGGSATQTLLGVKEGITRTRGVWRDYQGDDGAAIPTLPMFHPAYLLRQPAAKRQAWADLRKLARAVEEMGGGG